jgi:carboxypeptidase C (cathepsin A)
MNTRYRIAVAASLLLITPLIAQSRRDRNAQPPPSTPSPQQPTTTPPDTLPVLPQPSPLPTTSQGTSPSTPPAVSSAQSQQFPAPPAVERTSRTQHTLMIGGKSVPYTATAGTLVLKKEDGKPRASIFYVAYTRDDIRDRTKWPLTFSFNGGPGSSSVWLHMGAFGPRRVAMGGPDGQQPAPPYRLVDNEDTALGFTDIVFIDPVTTGFSRHAPGENPQQFHGLDGDLESVGEFIRMFTSRSERWLSPKFLAGESYGTTRAAALSQYLLQTHGIYLNGIVLVSSILNFETTSFAAGNDLPYMLFLPTYTAAAWYHKKLTGALQQDLQQALTEARRFASTDYAAALMKGDQLPAAERTEMARKLANFTGLSADYLERANLRVPIQRFAKELLRSERRTIGRYDSRLEGSDVDAVGETPEYDPSYAAVQGAYTAAFNDYVRTQLKFDTDLPYEILTGKVRPWNYSRFENRYVNVAELLRQAMTQNPNLKVMVANGYYDMATPFFATEYTMSHLGLDPALAGNVSLTYCEAGHMLYIKKSCLDSLHNAMASFYQKSSGVAP